MSRVYTSVKRVAIWDGWCSPCGQEDRPLVLTRSGPGGAAAWLGGLSDDDRLLLLTCRVCGEWQFVPAREEDDPEILISEDVVIEEVPTRAPIEAPVAAVPAPRPPVPRIVTVPEPMTLPASSPAAVEAAARVLAAARAQTSTTAPTRGRRTSAAAPAGRSRTVRLVPAPALPAVLGLPANTRSVVLAAAS